MRREKLAGLEVIFSGGSDGAGGGDGVTVVLLHGFGAPGNDLVPLGDCLTVPDDTRFVFPAAPQALPSFFGGDARAWWMIDIERRMLELQSRGLLSLSEEVPVGMAESNQRLSAMLDELGRRFAVQPERTVLGGFSQGAMLALDVALRSERKPAGLVLMSGTLLCASQWVPMMKGLAGKPALLSHGRQDPILPFAAAEKLRDHLRAAGLVVDWIEFRGGHEIPPPVLERAGALISGVAATQTGSP
jgi:phospholipase/carboxylesterase